jgi:hypothetical protein
MSAYLDSDASSAGETALTEQSREAEDTPVPPLSAGAAHRAVRNVLANEYGITRAYVEQLVRDTVEKEVKNILENQVLTSKRVDEAIHRAVYTFVKDGLPASHWNRAMSFREFVVAEIQKSIKEAVLERFEFSITAKANSTGEHS